MLMEESKKRLKKMLCLIQMKRMTNDGESIWQINGINGAVSGDLFLFQCNMLATVV